MTVDQMTKLMYENEWLPIDNLLDDWLIASSLAGLIINQIDARVWVCKHVAADLGIIKELIDLLIFEWIACMMYSRVWVGQKVASDLILRDLVDFLWFIFGWFV